MGFYFIFCLILFFYIQFHSSFETKSYRTLLFDELNKEQREGINVVFSKSTILSSLYNLYSQSGGKIPLPQIEFKSDPLNPRVLFLVRSYHGHFNEKKVFNIFNFLSSLKKQYYTNWNAIIFNTDNILLPELPEPYKSDSRISIINMKLDNFIKFTNNYYTQSPFPTSDIDTSKFQFNQIFVNNANNFTHKFDEWQAGYEVTDRILDLLNYFNENIFDYIVITNGDNYYYPRFLEIFNGQKKNQLTNNIKTEEENEEEEKFKGFNEDDETFLEKNKELVEDGRKESFEFDLYISKYYSRYFQAQISPPNFNSVMYSKGYQQVYGTSQSDVTKNIFYSSAPFLSHLGTSKLNFIEPMSMSKDVCYTPLMFRGFIDLGGGIFSYKKFQSENLRFLKFGDVNCQDGLLFNLLTNFYIDSNYYTDLKKHFSFSDQITKINTINDEKAFKNIISSDVEEEQIKSLQYFFPNITNLSNFRFKDLASSFVYIKDDPITMYKSDSYRLKRWKVKFIEECLFSHSPNPYSCSKRNGAWYLSPSTRSELSDSCWEKITLNERIRILNKKINDVYKVEFDKYQQFLKRNKDFEKLYKYYKANKDTIQSPLRKDERELIRNVESNYYFDLDVLQNRTNLNMEKSINPTNNLTMYSLPSNLHNKSKKKFSYGNNGFFSEFVHRLGDVRSSFCSTFKNFILTSNYHLMHKIMMVYIPLKQELIPFYFNELIDNKELKFIKGKVIFIMNDETGIENFKSFNKKNSIDLKTFSYFKFWKFDSYNFIASNPDLHKYLYNIFLTKLNGIKAKLKPTLPKNKSAKYLVANKNNYLSNNKKANNRRLMSPDNIFKTSSFPTSLLYSNTSTNFEFFKRFIRTQHEFMFQFYQERYCIENRPLDLFTPRSYYYASFEPIEYIIPIDINGNRLIY